MESHLGLMLEQICALYIDILIVLMMSSLKAYFLETHCDILMVKSLAMMKVFGFPSPLLIH